MIIQFQTENKTIPILWLCSAFGLVRSSYYAGLKSIAVNDRLDLDVWQNIAKIWEKFPGIGYRKLSDLLKINGKKILRILKKFRKVDSRLITKKPKPIRKIPNVIRLITQSLLDYPEKIARNNWILRDGKNKYRKVIDPTRPYQLWAGDWKELKLPFLGVTLYIFVIIDCYTKQLMGWKLSIIKDAPSAIQAAEHAIKTATASPEFNPRKLIMHTDQGSAYLADETIRYWRQLGVILSTADKGKPTQNPYIESFFSILSRFWLKYQDIITILDAQKSLNHFFNLYNEEWPHGSLNHLSPNQKLKEAMGHI